MKLLAKEIEEQYSIQEQAYTEGWFRGLALGVISMVILAVVVVGVIYFVM